MAEKADQFEIMERIYEVSLLLRRKPVSYIIQYAAEKWKVGERQTHKYIKLARKEWKKYFDKLTGDGMGYHVSQLRDLKDQALNRQTVIGLGFNRQIINVPDLNLAFEIAKEEGKLMGIYPSEKYKIEVEGELKIIDAKQKLISKLDSLASKEG